MVSCNTSAQSLKKKIPLIPPNKNNHFNYNGYVSVQPQCGWQDPAEVALATGDGDEVWADLQGNYRVVWRKEGAEACLHSLLSAQRELLLAASWLLSVSSSLSGDNWRCTQCKHVSLFQS